MQYTNGIFKIHTHAALCVGLGAEGSLSYEVNVGLLEEFIKWFFYQLYHADSFLRGQKVAILRILQWSHTQADCNNVIQHVAANGEKGSFSTNFDMLRRFFHSEAPHDLDLPGMESHHLKTFDDWYNSLIAKLKKEPTRGYPVVRSDSMMYLLQLDFVDHPLFSSLGDRAFYACTKY